VPYPRALPDGVVRSLVHAARDARRRAYAPYSRFRVGAAVLTATGRIISGANVENASYGLSVCAERTAIQRAVTDGSRRLRAVAVSTGRAGALPCGACRQVMLEFGVRTVIVDRPAGGPVIHRLADLLGHPFEPSVLRRRRRVS
jgi:cytidine deaminase